MQFVIGFGAIVASSLFTIFTIQHFLVCRVIVPESFVVARYEEFIFVEFISFILALLNVLDNSVY